VVGTLLGPIFMVAITLIPALIAGQGGEGSKVQIADKTGVIAKPLADELSAKHWQPEIVAPETPEQTLLERVGKKQINGFITIPANGLDGGLIYYKGDNGSSQQVTITINRTVQKVVQRQRGVRDNVSVDRLDRIFKDVNVKPEHTTGQEAVSGMA